MLTKIVRITGAIASYVAVILIIEDVQPTIDVFRLADPTDSWGIRFHVGGLLANLTVIFVAVSLMTIESNSKLAKCAAMAVFAPSLLEVLAMLPCFLSAHPGSLCGVGAIVVADASVPFVLGAAIVFLALTRSLKVTLPALGLVILFFCGYAIASSRLRPRSAADCRKLGEVVKAGNCLNGFATQSADENICRSIEFRMLRLSCLRDVAIKKQQPRICDEIRDPLPVLNELPARDFRDACFRSLANALHDGSLCGKIEDSQRRAGCVRQSPSNHD